jgi:hypothetical protein
MLFDYLFANLDKPVILYSVFGKTPVPSRIGVERRSAYYVMWSGEPFVRDDDSEFDVRLTMPLNVSILNDDIVFPLFSAQAYVYYGFGWENRLLTSRSRSRSQAFRRAPNFCCQVVSNNNHDSHVRNKFFEKFAQVRPIASMGRLRNNVGFLAPQNANDNGHGEYFDTLGKFRFMICFENSAGDTYLTEKILNAWLGGTIPIYWGCRSAPEWLNPRAFFQLNEEATDESMDELIQKVIALDDDPDAYRTMWEQPLMTQLHDSLNLSKIRDQVKIKFL